MKLNRPLKRGRNQPVGNEREKSQLNELQEGQISGNGSQHTPSGSQVQKFSDQNTKLNLCDEQKQIQLDKKQNIVHRNPRTKQDACTPNTQTKDLFLEQISVAEFLQRELNLIGLKVKTTQEDRSFFRAMADQLWGEEEQYLHVLYHMYECIKQRYREIVPSLTIPQVKLYLQQMVEEDINVGSIEFATASLAFGVNICIYRCQTPPYVIQNFSEDADTIYLSYHYQSNFGSIRTMSGVWKGGSILQQLRNLYQHLYKTQKNVMKQKNYRPKPKQNNTVKTEKIPYDKKKFKDKYQYARKLQDDHHYISIESLNKDLRKLGLKQKLIPADGNCLFRAVGDQLKGIESNHRNIRRIIMSFVERQEDRFGPFVVNGSFKSYVKRKKQDQVWGGLIELQATSLLFKVNICIFQEGQSQRIISNFDDTGNNTIFLSYDGAHYNSVRRIDDDGQGPVKPPNMKILPKQTKSEEHQNNLEKVRQALMEKRLQEQEQKMKYETYASEESNFSNVTDQNIKHHFDLDKIEKQNLELNS